MPKLLAWAAALFLFPLSAFAEPQPATITPIAAYMLLGPDGQRIARVVTEVKDCPALFVDGTVVEMHVRVAAGTAPLRPTASRPDRVPLRQRRGRWRPRHEPWLRQHAPARFDGAERYYGCGHRG